MLQVKSGATAPFKIKGIRKVDQEKLTAGGTTCSSGADDGLDKPPC
jgi:hypothetical protein